MVEILSSRRHFSWQLLSFAIAGALLGTLPEMIEGNEIGTFLVGVLALAVVSLVLIVIAINNLRRHAFSVPLMLVIYCLALWTLHRLSTDLRTTAKWLVEAKSYKSQVLSLPEPKPGELKHVEWEGWGFPGAGDTVKYLVFDPSDDLSSAVKSHSSGNLPGLPCEVVQVRQLEKYWYTALFYTDTDWNHCT